MMRKFYSRLIVVFALMLIGITGAWAQQRTQVDLPATPGYTLQPGNMYMVRGNMTIAATTGSALNVATKRSN